MASPAPLYAVPIIDIAPFRDGSDKRGVARQVAPGLPGYRVPGDLRPRCGAVTDRRDATHQRSVLRSATPGEDAGGAANA